jgi:hypothetical protein
LIFLSCFHGDILGLNQGIFFIIYASAILFIENIDGADTLTKWLYYFILVVCITTIVSFLLSVIGVVGNTYVLESSRGRDYYLFFLTFTDYKIYEAGPGNIFRAYGIFNEPGAFALYILYALALNVCFFNNKFHQFILILSGLITFSFAFFFSFALCFFIILRNTKSFIIFIFILVSIYLFAISNDETRKFIDYKIGKRFEYSETRGIHAFNRAESIRGGYRFFLQKPFFGWGKIKADRLPYNQSSFMSIIVDYGLIGFLLYLMPVIMLLLKSALERNFKILIMTIAFLLNFLARPSYSQPFTYMIIYLLYFYSNNNIIQKYKKNEREV